MLKLNYFLPGWLFFAVFLNLNTAWAERMVSDLSLEQKVGQLFLIGILETEMTPSLARHLDLIKPGGVILFKRNILEPYQSFKLNRSLVKKVSEVSRIAPLLAVDQEGGRVVRIATYPSIPSPLAIGSTGDVNLAKAYGVEIGKLLRRLGFNMNLAPVLDVLNPKVSSFIGDRSFGFKSELVGKLGQSFSFGLAESGVIPTGKHFPGSGTMTEDPHYKLATATGLGDRKDSQRPFKDFSRVFPSAIMLSHASYPEFSKPGIPATFAKEIVTDYLRSEIKFKGLAITDDLLMSGAKIYPNIGDAAVQAILAGNDLIMVTWSKNQQKEAFAAVLSAVKSGVIPKEILDEHVSRILSIKNKIPRFDFSARYPSNAEKVISVRSLDELDALVLNLNLQEQFRKVPWTAFNKGLVLLANSYFRQNFRGLFKGKLLEIKTPKHFNERSLKRLVQIVQNKPEPIVAVCSNKKCMSWISGLPESVRKNCIVVNVGGPATIVENRFMAVLNMYHDHEDLASLLAEKLSGPTVGIEAMNMAL